MNDWLGILREQGAWAIALAVGLPLALVVVTELGFALARRGHPAVVWLRRTRLWVLPAIAGVIYLRTVLGLPSDNVWVRVAETATWVVFVIVALGAANAVIFEAAAVGSWQQRVPRLLRDLLRTLLVVFAASLAYSFIWNREIQGALAALGVTSIVVGLALQEPLGNLFSGLMLLMERPFEIGDTIEVGGVSGTVKEINWRSAHIEALGGMIQVVPNSTLNKETISNYSRPLPIRMEMLELAFSSDTPPNEVRALLEVARTTKGVVQSPKPIAATIGYGNHSVDYRLIWRVAETDRWSVRNDLITRIWYMTRRHGLSLPYPVSVNIQHQTDAPFEKSEAAPADILRRLPHLPQLPEGEHGVIRALSFGKGEVIFDEGQVLDSVYILVKGAVSMQLVRQAEIAEIASVGPGQFFGEAGMHGTHSADSRAVAVEDTEVLLLRPDTVRHLFEASPTLARDTGRVLDVRRKALQSARTALRRH